MRFNSRTSQQPTKKKTWGEVARNAEAMAHAAAIQIFEEEFQRAELGN
jgi:hypothetical protein